MNLFQEEILQGLPTELPEAPAFDPLVSRAPKRPLTLSIEEQKLAIKNALRYFPEKWHSVLAPEFYEELKTRGRIYMYRFRPHYKMHARSIDDYPGNLIDCKAIQLMIQNNLDPEVAQHPYELVTYGGNGAVFQNWAQYLITMSYLAKMKEEQFMPMYSGHPMGLFPAPKGSPRVVVTNGMMIPLMSTHEEYTKLSALGVTSYGQMTAGSYMYIGPQGIVHGTYLTVLGAAQIHLGLEPGKDLGGVVFVTSGLGGMSGAQAKASRIAGAVGVVAEVNEVQAKKLQEQGWVDELYNDLEKLSQRIEFCRNEKQGIALGYVGNVIDLWAYLADHNIKIDLGSDQTSLHAPYTGGYYPQGLSVEESNELMAKDPERFKSKIHESLREHVKQVKRHTDNGMFFWDYGNAFLRMAEVAGADIKKNDKFIYPSYVENIMGPQYFDYGFGPFRWVCTSGDQKDLIQSDKIAGDVLKEQGLISDEQITTQLNINQKWIERADENKLVVGSQARILYSDLEGRRKIALALNKAIQDGIITKPIVLGRDHHDVSGTDSPYRETANIYDGSAHTADMAVHNFMGLGFHGATWASLHNGGGVGWGYVVNGGFGLLIDGSEASEKKINSLFPWDVGNGLARRAWAGNKGAKFATSQAEKQHPGLALTHANEADDDLINHVVQ